MEELRSTRVAVEGRKEPWHRSGKLVSIATAIMAATVALYIAKPSIEVTDVSMVCPLCDRGGPFTPSSDIAISNQGAVFNVRLQNTGNMSTELIDHNLTTHTFTHPSPKAEEFIESPDAIADHIPIQIGAHSFATVSMSRGEVVALALRQYELLKLPPPNFYLYGHATYRVLFLHSRTDFCFRYIPPTKGLPESWSVCAR